MTCLKISLKMFVKVNMIMRTCWVLFHRKITVLSFIIVTLQKGLEPFDISIGLSWSFLIKLYVALGARFNLFPLFQFFLFIHNLNSRQIKWAFYFGFGEKVYSGSFPGKYYRIISGLIHGLIHRLAFGQCNFAF